MILYDNDDSVGFGHLWTQSPTAGNEIDLTGLETLTFRQMKR